MGQNSALPPSDTFIQALRSALNHLYDPDILRQSRLVSLFGVDNRFDSPSALQSILTKAIETLKPRPAAPNRAHTQVVYDLLLYRYVQQVNQDEIASQMGISVRHLRRQQNLAVYELACKLWEQYHLVRQETLDEGLSPGEIDSTAATLGENGSELSQELDWLNEPMLPVQTDLSLAIPNALELIQPLLQQNRICITVAPKISGLLVVHPVAFQQVLLSLLSFIIRIGDQEIKLELVPHPGQQEIILSGNRSNQCAMNNEEEQQTLQTLHQFITLSQGMFSFSSKGTVFQAGIIFRSIEPVEILVIDDNPEIITMMQRYAAESIYRIIGINDPRLAIEQALKVRPKLIVLDIMMPQIDGLQVLSRIKHHPELGHIPVIICSVLPQKDLAASLGASGFISKPFKRDPFITTLDSIYQQAIPTN